MRAFRSTIWAGAKPYFSRKAAGSISWVVVCPIRVVTSST